MECYFNRRQALEAELDSEFADTVFESGTGAVYSCKFE
jgi:hypothetical protein